MFAVASCSTETISETAGTDNLAATRGRRDFADEVCAETKCEYGEPEPSNFSRSGETASGIGAEYCSPDE